MNYWADDNEPLLRQAANGDEVSWQAILAVHEDRLRRMIAHRLDPRIRGRLDETDVLQEAYLQAWSHLTEYLENPEVPFFLWLRGIVGHKVQELHRYHLGTKKRDARREVSLYGGGLPEASSAMLAAQLLGRLTRPSTAAVRAEMKSRLQEVLNDLEPLDREILVLRHFEQLSPAETAVALGIKEKAAGMRYVRALRRLKEVLMTLPGSPLEP